MATVSSTLPLSALVAMSMTPSSSRQIVVRWGERQDQHAEMRQKAVDTLRSSVWIGTGLQDEQTAEYTLGKYPQQLCLYKQNPTGVDSRGSQTWPSVFYLRDKHTRKGNNRIDLPSEALDAATCFIVYDGQAHFWAALRDAEPPTLEQMLAAGMVMEAPFSTF
ncbi:TPA: hypothetical protein ACH3X1_011296 [Trebouxia sp. C0004]